MEHPARYPFMDHTITRTERGYWKVEPPLAARPSGLYSTPGQAQGAITNSLLALERSLRRGPTWTIRGPHQFCADNRDESMCYICGQGALYEYHEQEAI